MAKQSISIKDTKISNGGAYGNQIEQTVSVDDNILAAPQELAEYLSLVGVVSIASVFINNKKV